MAPPCFRSRPAVCDARPSDMQRRDSVARRTPAGTQDRPMTEITRRVLLQAGGALALSAGLVSSPMAQPADGRTAYRFFTPEEAAFIEAAVDRLIPPEPDWPGAREAELYRPAARRTLWSRRSPVPRGADQAGHAKPRLSARPDAGAGLQDLARCDPQAVAGGRRFFRTSLARGAGPLPAASRGGRG